MRSRIRGIATRVVIFTVVSLLFMFGLLTVFGQFRFDSRASYRAVFSNVSGLKGGNFVRIAGVEVGKVKDLTLHKDGTVTIDFAIDRQLTLTEGTTASVRYENLIGDRYLALEEGPGSVRKLLPGQTIPLSRTSPALDVDALIGGFRPLFRALDPDQVNALSGELLRVFQGQGGTISSVLAQTSALTTTLAGRDQLIGEVITNLNTVVGTFAARDTQFADGLDKLSQLVQGLADRKSDIAAGVANINAAAGSVADLLTVAREPIKQIVQQTDRVSGQIEADHDYVDDLVKTLPDAYQILSRNGLYGDYFSFYLCDALLKLNGKGGQPVYVKVAGQDSVVHAEMTRKRLNIKPLAERNRLAVGATGIALIVAIVVAAFSYDKIPFIKGTTDHQAYFADAGGIKTGSDVRVSGLGVGRVSGIHLEGAKVRVDFTVRDGVELGDRTEAAIKTETVLGTKVLELTPRGDRNLDGPIPIERTTSPYDLPAALGDLTTTISGLDTTQLSSALKTLAQTFQNTPPELKLALESVARFSDTLGTRDAKLRQLLADANKVSSVSAKRSDQIARLVVNTDALLGEILLQRNSVETLMANVSAATQQLSGLVKDNRTQLKPAVDKLNGVLGILDNRKQELQRTLYLLRRYAMSFGEVLGAGPFFKASLVNLFPGQFDQPFVDAAFSDLGLDPNVLLPSQLTEPGVGQPGTPPLPSPYPRTGQGGPPNLTLPDAITGNPGDPRYPYREPLPAPAPGGPAPGPPAPGPAPGEVPAPTVPHPTPLPPSNHSPSGSPGVISDPVSPVGGR